MIHKYIIMCDYGNELTVGQIALLETIKPLKEWIYELNQYVNRDIFDNISETFWQHDKNITFDDFYYAGIDQTPKIEDDDERLKLLMSYKQVLYDDIPNYHYRGIIDRTIKNFIIGKTTFEYAKHYLRNMIKSYID